MLLSLFIHLFEPIFFFFHTIISLFVLSWYSHFFFIYLFSDALFLFVCLFVCLFPFFFSAVLKISCHFKEKIEFLFFFFLVNIKSTVLFSFSAQV